MRKEDGKEENKDQKCGQDVVGGPLIIVREGQDSRENDEIGKFEKFEKFPSKNKGIS